jgi:predicted MFS family arabinose efflux permease
VDRGRPRGERSPLSPAPPEARGLRRAPARGPAGTRAGRRAPGSPHLRHELRAFRNGQVWLFLVVTVLGHGGMFGTFTCIAYTLTRVTGFASVRKD